MDTDSRAGFALLSRGGPALCLALARVSKLRARSLERDETPAEAGTRRTCVYCMLDIRKPARFVDANLTLRCDA